MTEQTTLDGPDQHQASAAGVPTEVDVVVIGLGPGGEAVATTLAQAGLRVVGVDRRLAGGECPYYGCIPSKMMLRAADALAEARRVDGLAGHATVEPDWSPVHTRIRDEATTDWDDQAAVDRLEAAGVVFVRGEARLDGPGRVLVDGSSYAVGTGVVLNTGTEPAVPDIEGLAGTPFWTNREAVRLETLPSSLAVIGGGPIGAELAQVFARFGVRVTVLEVGPRILAPAEPESSAVLAEAFVADGIQVLSEVQIGSVAYQDGHFAIDLGDQRLEVEKLLVATGRRTNLGDLGLETVGLDPESHHLDIDERCRVTDGVWAIGDITGKGAFTHVSMYQATVTGRDVLGQDGPPADYRAVPWVTFTDPEVAGVGMSEQQARDAGLTVRVGRSSDLGSRGWLAQADGLVKLVEDADRGVLVGANVVGPSAGEILSMLVTAVHAEVPTATLRTMMYAFPTFHRAVETAVNDLADPDQG